MKTIADDIAIRPLREDEVHLLRDFLYEAVFMPEGIQPPPRDIVDLPALQVYIRGFGEEKDDLCLVAEHHGRAIGAVWSRIMNDYGHIDGDTPSLAISLYKGYRNKGIGTRLLSAMLKLLSESGYHKVSLSVQKANSAVRMYERSGFKTIRTTGEEYVMVKDLSEIYSMRPLTEQDIPEMQELFRTTVLTVNARDYTEEEVQDWASCGDSTEHWKELLSANSYIGAVDPQGGIIGYSSMNSDGHLHSMFVHKDWQGKGVASMLLKEVEKMARGYGACKISAEVSITARPFFEKRGYRVVAEQKAKANKLYMTNYRMEKETRICQSCGRPMPSEYVLGTHGDGHPCTEYCRNCFQNGLFTSDSIEEQRKAIAASGRRDAPDLRTLKRWMPVAQQAAWILDRCGYVILSTIDVGIPEQSRPVIPA